MKHLSIRIYGSVQGVFFRYSAKSQAEKLGIKGLVRNESDGSVYIEAEGDGAALEKFLEWCRSGPMFASIERVEAEEAPLKNFTEFVIL